MFLFVSSLGIILYYWVWHFEIIFYSKISIQNSIKFHKIHKVYDLNIVGWLGSRYRSCPGWPLVLGLMNIINNFYFCLLGNPGRILVEFWKITENDWTRSKPAPSFSLMVVYLKFTRFPNKQVKKFIRGVWEIRMKVVTGKRVIDTQFISWLFRNPHELHRTSIGLRFCSWNPTGELLDTFVPN